MKKNIILTIIFSLFFIATIAAKGKVIVIKGQITDLKTGEAIPFVNLGVAGTYIGAASNMDGFYEVKIPQKYAKRKLQISAVGYATIKKDIEKIDRTRPMNIRLESKIFNIGEVEVVEKSKLLYTYIKKAVKRISKNYLQTPFNYDMYYREELSQNKKMTQRREVAVSLYDNKGYKRGDAYQVFKERGYKFLEVRRNFENKTLADGSTQLDELLGMDIVRVRGNVLNLDNIDEYNLKLEGETELEGDKVWIISYNNPTPSLSSSGDYYVKSYKGKLYIKQKDFAVVKNITQVGATNYSEQGRSFYVDTKRQKLFPQDIRYSFTTVYKSFMGYYYLSYISYTRDDRWIDKISAKPTMKHLEAELLITDLETFKPTLIEKRSYYENKPYNEDFWKSYNIIRDRIKH